MSRTSAKRGRKQEEMMVAPPKGRGLLKYVEFGMRRSICMLDDQSGGARCETKIEARSTIGVIRGRCVYRGCTL